MLILPVFGESIVNPPTHTSTYVIPQLIVFAGFIFLLYLLVLRPQTKRQQEKHALLSDLKIGDVIYTTGGIVGKIITLHQDFCEIEVANNTFLHIQRGAVTDLVPQGSLKSLGF